MAEAEARRNNMLKEKCVVLEYKINRLGMQIISLSYLIAFQLLQCGLSLTFKHPVEIGFVGSLIDGIRAWVCERKGIGGLLLLVM